MFGVSELLRHFVTVPEPSFLQKCNITVEECHNKAQQFQQLPFSTTTNTSYCRSENTPELFNSLHHFPDKTCCIIGASIVTFLATLYFWPGQYKRKINLPSSFHATMFYNMC